MRVDGACHCGRVSYSAEIDPERVLICHCHDCQVLSGAPFRAAVPAPYDTVELRGETRSYVKVAESGNRRAQVFCPECATPLWATSPEKPTYVMLRLGCVKQRAQLVPRMQIWQSCAMPWLDELAHMPGTPEQQGMHRPPASKP